MGHVGLVGASENPEVALGEFSRVEWFVDACGSLFVRVKGEAHYFRVSLDGSSDEDFSQALACGAFCVGYFSAMRAVGDLAVGVP